MCSTRPVEFRARQGYQNKSFSFRKFVKLTVVENQIVALYRHRTHKPSMTELQGKMPRDPVYSIDFNCGYNSYWGIKRSLEWQTLCRALLVRRYDLRNSDGNKQTNLATVVVCIYFLRRTFAYFRIPLAMSTCCGASRRRNTPYSPMPRLISCWFSTILLYNVWNIILSFPVSTTQSFFSVRP